jgi:hypothetical protein
MRWYLRVPQDGTLYAGEHDGDHIWTIDPLRAKSWPSHHQATLAGIALDRAYEDVGFYTTEVVSEKDLWK